MNKDGGKRLAGGKPEKPKKATPQKSGAKGRRWNWRQILLIVLAVVLALALAGVLAWRSLFVRPELPQKDSGPQSGSTGDAAEPAKIDYGDGIRPRAEGERKSADYYTVLIIGRDTGGGGLTDTLLLASYDVTNQKATVMSIPRDTMVNVPWDVKKINSVYNYYGGGEKGIQNLYKEVSQLVGFEPDFQVVVEWEAVGEIVDAMGGVYFDVPRDMNYEDPYQNLSIHQKKGYRLLSGDDAMQVIRYRHDNNLKYGYADGDLGRIKTQQAFLKAVVSQLLQVKNMTKIGALIEVFQKNVETDMSFQNILWFAQQAVMGGLEMEDVNFVTMPNRDIWVYSRSVTRQIGRYNEQSYVVPQAKQLLELVNSELSPFAETFTLSDLDIMSKNSDGSVRSSTGYVEDRPAASPPPSAKPKEDPEETETPEGTDPAIDPETGLPLESDPEGGENTGAGDAVSPGGPAGFGEGGDLSGGVQSPEGAEPPENPSTPESPGGQTGEGGPPPEALPGDSGTTVLPESPAEEEPPEGGQGEEPLAPEAPAEPGFIIIEPLPTE